VHFKPGVEERESWIVSGVLKEETDWLDSLCIRRGDRVVDRERRHRIDNYLDTLLANQTARKVTPLTIDKKVSARWKTARVIISLILLNQSQQNSFAVIGYAEAGRRRSPITCHLL